MIEQQFLISTTKFFEYYKKLGEGAMDQLSEEDLNRKPNELSNSVGHIVHHLSGSMLSRWTDFMMSDGEKEWRNREAEFEEGFPSKEAMIKAWEKGWKCLFDALESVKPNELLNVIYVRNEEHTVLDAIQRQFAHYAYHVGQIVYQAKAIRSFDFRSLSIPKGESETFNKQKFNKL